MAGFNLNGIIGVKNKYSTNVIAALLNDTNLLDITKNKELQTLIIKTSGKLFTLVTVPEEKISDTNTDEELNKQETKAKLIGDFKIQLEETVLGKFNITVDDLVEFKSLTKEEKNTILKNYLTDSPKYQSISGSIDTKITIYSSLIDKQLNSGKELFDLVKSNERIYVSGIVVDELTGDPVKGAQVEFTSPTYDSISAFKDITNKKGKFTIEIPSASFNDPLAKLTPEEIEQVAKVNLLLNSPKTNQTSSNFPSSNVTTNNPILLNFIGSINVPYPVLEEPDEPVVQSNLTGSNSIILTATPNPITIPDLSGYTLYSAKDETGTPTQPLYSGITNLSGSFQFFIPKDVEYVSVSKGSGTNIVLYTTFNASELNLEDFNYIELPNPESDSNTLSNTSVETVNKPISSLSEDKITIKSQNYTTGNMSPYKGDGTVKNKLILKLTPIVKTLEVEKINALLPNMAVTQELTKNKKDAKWYQNEKLAKVSRELTSTMLPVVLTMAASFGVSKLGEKVEKGKGKIQDIIGEISCPTTEDGQSNQEVIIKIIAKKNKLVKQLNDTLNIINTTTKALGIAGTSIEIMNASYLILKNIPIPSSTGVPGVPGIPINVINNIQDTKIKIEKTIASLRGFNIGLLATLVVLRQTLVKIIAYLNALDGMIQFCSPDSSQEQISKELTALTVQQTEQTSPIVIDVNGFSLAMETEPTTNPLKRRRAIAKNKGNVIMLQGEWSFSSIDQILIDELVFYIQVNNLKAD